MNGNLPWSLIFIGVFIAVVVEIMGMPVLPVAIGLYLPLELSSTIMIGGLIRWIADRLAGNKEQDNGAGGGILFCSGMIAGEGIVGILLAILAVLGVTDALDMSSAVNGGIIGSLLVLAVMVVCVFRFSRKAKKS